MKTVFIFFITIATALLYSNATKQEIDFTLGNKNKWNVYLFKKASWSKVDGFTGTTNPHGRLVSTNVNISAKDFNIIEVITNKKWNN